MKGCYLRVYDDKRVILEMPIALGADAVPSQAVVLFMCIVENIQRSALPGIHIDLLIKGVE